MRDILDDLREYAGEYPESIMANAAEEIASLRADLAAARALLRDLRQTYGGVLLHEHHVAIDAALRKGE